MAKQATETMMGLHELYKPKDSPATVEYVLLKLSRDFCSHQLCSIVAIHGLNGHATKTWSAISTGICWLGHPDYLPKHIPNARVLAYGYNSSISNLTGQTPSSDRIHHHAQTLVQELSANRRVNTYPTYRQYEQE
jgi:hypothetical protein